MPVRPLKLPSVYVIPPSVEFNVCEPVSKLPPPSRVSDKSARSTPVTGSVKTIVMLLTPLLRGSGVTAVIVAVGAVVSTVHVSLALAVSRLLAVSRMFAPLAVSVSE